MKKQLAVLSEPTNYVNLERLIFLVDRVFAITITLLVLESRPLESDMVNLARRTLQSVEVDEDRQHDKKRKK